MLLKRERGPADTLLLNFEVGILWAAIDILCYLGPKWDVAIILKITQDVNGSS